MALTIQINPSVFPSGANVSIEIYSSAAGVCNLSLLSGNAGFSNGTTRKQVTLRSGINYFPETISGSRGPHIIEARRDSETDRFQFNIN